MKLKYYLRGLGIGIIITTVVLMIAYSGHKTELTDEEIIKRAEALGMVMEDDSLFPNSETQKDTQVVEVTESLDVTELSTEQLPETEIQTEQPTESEVTNESEQSAETEVTNESEQTIETESTSESEQPTESEVETEPEQESESEIVEPREMYRLVIRPGMVPRLICNELEENGVIENAASLRQYLVEVGYATSIVVGEYEIPYGATNEEVYQILKAGPL